MIIDHTAWESFIPGARQQSCIKRRRASLVLSKLYDARYINYRDDAKESGCTRIKQDEQKHTGEQSRQSETVPQK